MIRRTRCSGCWSARPGTCRLARGSPAGASTVVVRGRERVSLALDLQLILVELAADLCPRLLVLVGLSDILLRRHVSRRGHLVRVVVVDPGRYPLLLGKAGEPVVIDVLRTAAVLMTVAPELLVWLACVLLRHYASNGIAGRTGPGPHRSRYPWP